jgi:5-oxoprolinase (ATP-hydrolysing) subunit A
MARKLTIDLSTELAEGFAIDPFGVPLEVLSQVVIPASGRQLHPRQLMARADDALLPIVSSAYLACGLHSGDPLVIQRLVPELITNGITIGAHPSYPDLFDFGQHRVVMTEDELVSVFLYQLGALQGILRQFDQKIAYVKCHGALYFDVAEDTWACDALICAINIFDPEIIIVAPAGTPTMDRLRASGLRIAREGFADRGYDNTGRILARDHPQALHQNPDEIVAQVLNFVERGVVEAEDGSVIPLRVDTLCLHSDTPGAAETAHAIADALRKRGIAIAPMTTQL